MIRDTYHTQASFDPLTWVDQGHDHATAAKLAQKARREYVKVMKSGGHDCRMWTLTGQLRKYKSFGVECGQVRNVYYVTICHKDGV